MTRHPVLTFADSQTEPQPSQNVHTQLSLKNNHFLEMAEISPVFIHNRTSADGIIIQDFGIGLSEGIWIVEHTHLSGKKFRAAYLKSEITPRLD